VGARARADNCGKKKKPRLAHNHTLPDLNQCPP
jgi:hypothetical protein